MNPKILSTYTILLPPLLFTEYLNLVKWDQTQLNTAGLQVPLQPPFLNSKKQLDYYLSTTTQALVSSFPLPLHPPPPNTHTHTLLSLSGERECSVPQTADSRNIHWQDLGFSSSEDHEKVNAIGVFCNGTGFQRTQLKELRESRNERWLQMQGW